MSDPNNKSNRNGSWLRYAAARMLDGSMRRRMRLLQGRDLRGSAIVFAPHFDDEVLGCGGTIIRKRSAGAPVRIVFMTDGSRSHAHVMPEAELRKVRASEGRAAARVLGVPDRDVALLGFPEGRLGEHQPAAVEAVTALLHKHQPQEVFVPYRRDAHRDHIATHTIVRLALAAHGQPVWFYEYPVWFWYRWPWVASAPGGWRRILPFYRDALCEAMHGWRQCRWAVSISEVLEQKRDALLQHRSQTIRWDGNPAWQTLGDVADGEFLARFFRSHEVFSRRRAGVIGEEC